MTIKEFKEKLNKYDENATIVYLDSETKDLVEPAFDLILNSDKKVITAILVNGEY